MLSFQTVLGVRKTKFQTALHLGISQGLESVVLWTDWEEPTQPIPNRTSQLSNVNTMFKRIDVKKTNIIPMLHTANVMKCQMSCHEIPNPWNNYLEMPWPCDTLCDITVARQSVSLALCRSWVFSSRSCFRFWRPTRFLVCRGDSSPNGIWV